MLAKRGIDMCAGGMVRFYWAVRFGSADLKVIWMALEFFRNRI